jgi:hypothetical protein
VPGQLNLVDGEAVPASRAPRVTLCPPSLGQTEVETQDLSRCFKDLSACYMAALPRMFISRWYTSPTPSVEGVGNVSKSAATTTMFWLALVKAGSCRSAQSITMAWTTSSADSCWCRLASLASTATRPQQARPIAPWLYIRCHPVGRIIIPPGEPPVA